MTWHAERCCVKRLQHAQCGISASAVRWRLRVWVTHRSGPPRREPSPPAAGARRRPPASHARRAASSPSCLPARALFVVVVRCAFSKSTRLSEGGASRGARRRAPGAGRPAGAPPPGGAVHSLPLGPRERMMVIQRLWIRRGPLSRVVKLTTLNLGRPVAARSRQVRPQAPVSSQVRTRLV